MNFNKKRVILPKKLPKEIKKLPKKRMILPKRKNLPKKVILPKRNNLPNKSNSGKNVNKSCIISSSQQQISLGKLISTAKYNKRQHNKWH